ncbi:MULTISPECIES: peptidoglycan-binding protein [unclassified Streptomyces]|uniref:peptidoglycan-binding protein n=1 Tax=unclassified Streptomyces TaxID=2593676 RepID=UPI000DD7B2BE|nr:MULTISPECIES: peptidoglycan-binding protein [unclassified Streptomyces]QZZ26509.1 endolysin [Streptomyces sp. ST1015]
MPELWMPGATRLDIGDHAPTDGGPAKAIAHITWDRNASAAKPADLVPYTSLRSYFAGAGAKVAPHVLWDPFTGRITQFVPANSRSKSLVDAPGGTRTNRAGSVVLQIEALFFPYCRVGDTVYARLVDTPCVGWAELNAWVRSWGVPDVWPMGRPTSFASNRSASTWAKSGGWYGHSQVPENDHQDPGSWPAFTPSEVKPKPSFEPFPGASFFKAGRRSPIVKACRLRLIAEGCNRYASQANADVWGSGDVASYAAWQRKCGYTGSAADGIPGKTSWDKLKVPNV